VHTETTRQEGTRRRSGRRAHEGDKVGGHTEAISKAGRRAHGGDK
jgi:hypothetical protein